MNKIFLIFALVITTAVKAQSFSDYEQYQREQIKQKTMTVQTKYSPGDFVFIIIGSGDSARVYESQIASVTTVAAISGTTVTYSCGIDRTKIGTALPGTPNMTYTEKTEKNMYDTAESCFQAIVILNEEREKQKKQKKWQQ